MLVYGICGAFEEREFYRVNHFVASMGVLCHPNYSDEKVNGVGVSTDPVYDTEDNFYLNSQIGESLITNPDTTFIPEEILLDKNSMDLDAYTIIQRSNLIPYDSLVLSEEQLVEMRSFLTTIHDEFAQLYNATDDSTFAMDIEYKITSAGQLIVKQARPWVSYKPPHSPSVLPENELFIYPNPTSNAITIDCLSCGLNSIRIVDLYGNLVLEKEIGKLGSTLVDVQHLAVGVYIVSGFTADNQLLGVKKMVKK